VRRTSFPILSLGIVPPGPCHLVPDTCFCFPPSKLVLSPFHLRDLTVCPLASVDIDVFGDQASSPTFPDGTLYILSDRSIDPFVSW